MPRIHFNAPDDHTLEHAGEVLAFGGGEADVSDELTEQLLAELPGEVTVARSTLASKSRDELNKLAAEAGVEDPKALPNKDAVITAIENPPAATGEGQPTESATEENQT